MFSYSEMVAERAMIEGEAKGRVNTMAAIKAAKRMYKDGVSLREIAAKYSLPEEELEEILS